MDSFLIHFLNAHHALCLHVTHNKGRFLYCDFFTRIVLIWLEVNHVHHEIERNIEYQTYYAFILGKFFISFFIHWALEKRESQKGEKWISMTLWSSHIVYNLYQDYIE